MIIDSLLISLNTLTGMAVVWSAICTTNRMTRTTPWTIRLAYILVGVGAGAVVLAPGYLDRAPTVAELLLISGMALLAVSDRRRHHSRRLSRERKVTALRH